MQVEGWVGWCSGLATKAPEHSLEWQRGGELFLKSIVSWPEALFKTYYSDEVL